MVRAVDGVPASPHCALMESPPPSASGRSSAESSVPSSAESPGPSSAGAPGPSSAGPSARSSSHDLRALLLDAAWEILQEPDTPLDLRKVAERAGKSRTAPYLVFGKESEGGGVLGLRIAVAARGARLMNAQMEAAAKGVDDPLDAFRRVALAFLDFVSEHRRLFRLIYGPEIDAVSRLGEDGFREHPEFRELFDYRSRAGSVVSRIIHLAQDRGLLRPDGGGRPGRASRNDASRNDASTGEESLADEPLADESLADESRADEKSPPSPLDTPSARYLQIAWSTMIGMVVLRDDQLLHSIGWRITREQGARLIVESVFGLDPQVVEDATRTFMASHGVAIQGRVASPRVEGPAMAIREQSAPMAQAPMVQAPTAQAPMARPPAGRSPVAKSRVMEVRRASAPPIDDDWPGDDEGAVAREREPDEADASAATIDDEAPSAATFDEASDGLLVTESSAELSPGADLSPLAEPSLHDEPNAPPEPATMTVTEALESYSGLRRAAFSDRLRNRPRVLWIDDHPESIATEVDTLERLGAEITLARNTHEATRVLQRTGPAGGAGAAGGGRTVPRPDAARPTPFQVIVSDIARGSRPDAGVRALPELHRLAPGVPVIFFISAVDPDLGIPDGATGITDRTDELLHLIVDALEGR